MGKVLVALLLCSCHPSKGEVLATMIDSTIMVQNSSGIVVYSDPEQSLILTACHVIHSDLYNAKPVTAGFMVQDDVGMMLDLEQFDVDDAECDEDTDLAIVQIYPERQLTASKVALFDPSVGDDIWISANPNYNYHSLKKGIVSSTTRYGYWELSGGIVFGSSGGGAFNQRGELFGIAHAVDAYNTHYCLDALAGECIRVVLSDFGFFVRPDVIREYLLHSKFNDKFNYLKSDQQ
jgi:hypothetical protein